MLNISLEFVSLLLFDQDLLRLSHLAELFVLLIWVLVMHREDTKDTILTS